MYRCEKCGALNRVKSPVPGAEPRCGKCKEHLDLSGTPQAVGEDAAWRAIRSADVPILVDVWAPWCGPCRMVAPVLEGLSKEGAGRFITLKVNSDENPRFSQGLNVQGIPTFVIFKGGTEFARKSGAMPKTSFGAWLTECGLG